MIDLPPVLLVALPWIPWLALWYVFSRKDGLL
jgi:hypothetical protein